MADGAAALDIEAMITALGAVVATGLPMDLSGCAALQSERLVNAATAFAAMVQEQFDRSGGWALDGGTSAARWLASRTGSPSHVHKGRIRDGAALRVLPAAVEPALQGQLPADNLRALADCARRYPTLAQRDQDVLVGQAVELGARDHRAATRVWLSHAEDAADQPEPAPEPVSEVFLSKTLDGTYHLAGTLTAEDGAIVEAALEAIVDPLLRAGRDGDPTTAARPASALRAHALVDLVAQFLRREPSDCSAPDRYRVTVVVKHDDQPGESPLAPLRRTRVPGHARRPRRGPRRRTGHPPMAPGHPPGRHHP